MSPSKSLAIEWQDCESEGVGLGRDVLGRIEIEGHCGRMLEGHQNHVPTHPLSYQGSDLQVLLILLLESSGERDIPQCLCTMPRPLTQFRAEPIRFWAATFQRLMSE